MKTPMNESPDPAPRERPSGAVEREQAERTDDLFESFQDRCGSVTARIIEAVNERERRFETVRKELSFARKTIGAAVRLDAAATSASKRGLLLFDVDGTLVGTHLSGNERHQELRPVAFELARFLRQSFINLELGILSSRSPDELSDDLMDGTHLVDVGVLQGFSSFMRDGLDGSTILSSRTGDLVSEFVGKHSGNASDLRMDVERSLAVTSNHEYAPGVIAKAVMVEAINADKHSPYVATIADDDADMPDFLTIPGASVRSEVHDSFVTKALREQRLEAFTRVHLARNPEVSPEGRAFLDKYQRHCRGPWSHPDPSYLGGVKESDDEFLFYTKSQGVARFRKSRMKTYLERKLDAKEKTK